MQADPSTFVQADLRFLIPVRSGETVAILGDVPELAAALEEEHIQTYVIYLPTEATEIPLQNSSVDHIILPLLGKHRHTWLISEMARILKPGGWTFVGLRNAHSLQRLAFWKRKKEQHSRSLRSFSVRLFYKDMERAGFSELTSFGVSRDLSRPQFLIPLERSVASHFFFDRIYSPSSLSAAIAQKLAALITSAGMQRILFKDLLVLGQKRATASGVNV